MELQIERVRRTAHGQGVDLVVDESLLEHLAAAGFRPEFGARELRRLIRSELETQLARSMLANEVHEGGRVVARWDEEAGKVVLEPQPTGGRVVANANERPGAEADTHAADQGSAEAAE